MKYLFLGLIVTLVLTTFMIAFTASAAYAELRERVARGKSSGRN